LPGGLRRTPSRLADDSEAALLRIGEPSATATSWNASPKRKPRVIRRFLVQRRIEGIPPSTPLGKDAISQSIRLPQRLHEFS
jgi:hypothetical protein